MAGAPFQTARNVASSTASCCETVPHCRAVLRQRTSVKEAVAKRLADKLAHSGLAAAGERKKGWIVWHGRRTGWQLREQLIPVHSKPAPRSSREAPHVAKAGRGCHPDLRMRVRACSSAAFCLPHGHLPAHHADQEQAGALQTLHHLLGSLLNTMWAAECAEWGAAWQLERMPQEPATGTARSVAVAVACTPGPARPPRFAASAAKNPRCQTPDAPCVQQNREEGRWRRQQPQRPPPGAAAASRQWPRRQ